MRVTSEDLGHAFPGRPALFRSLDLDLRPGTVTAVTGPSGSGKSTLLGLLAGWLTPSEGLLRREGIDRIGWVLQNPHGVARRSAIDHVALPFLARGRNRRRAETEARRLLVDFGLLEVADRPFRELSGGEAQRLLLARGLAADPDLLLVDEPTAQLDSATAKTVSSTIGSLAAEDTIVVVTTHDQRARDACTHHLDLGASV